MLAPCASPSSCTAPAAHTADAANRAPLSSVNQLMHCGVCESRHKDPLIEWLSHTHKTRALAADASAGAANSGKPSAATATLNSLWVPRATLAPGSAAQRRRRPMQ